MARAVGIGLGATNSVIAVPEGGEPTIIVSAEGMHTTPPAVALSKTGEAPVGGIAGYQVTTNVDRTVPSVKRHMGTDWEITIDDEDYMVQEISTHIFSKLKTDVKAFLGEPVTDAAITIPAYFNDVQRQATKDAGQIVSPNVQYIVDEPAAMTLTYDLEKGKEDELTLVSDLGGDTFDASPLEIGKDEDGFSTIQVRATADDDRLGDDNWDRRTVDWFTTQVRTRTDTDLSKGVVALQRLEETAEQAKKKLSSSTSTNISLQYLPMTADGPIHLDKALTHAKFEEIISNLLGRTKKSFEDVIRNASISTSEIDHVILAGGSTRMPTVTKVVRELTDSHEPNKSVNPDEVVATGAALQTSVIQGDHKDALLINVAPLSLSIETKGGTMTKLIGRSTAISTKASEIFSTAEDGQPSVSIQVYQGERESAHDNELLGIFELSGITPAPHGVPQIEVIFDVGADGIVHISVKDRNIDKEQFVITTGGSTLPKEDTDHTAKEAEEHTVEGKERRGEADTRNQAEQVVYSIEKLLKDEADKVTEGTRTAVQADVDAVREALKGEDIEAVKSASDTLNASAMRIGEEVYTAQQAAETKDEQAEAFSTADDDIIGVEIVDEDGSR